LRTDVRLPILPQKNNPALSQVRILVGLNKKGVQSHAFSYAPRKLKAANPRLLVLVGSEDFCLYHGKFRKFSPGKLDQIKEGILRAAEPVGDPIKGQIPYGYKVENRRLIKDKGEQQIIRKIQRWKTENISLREIAKRLNQEKNPGKNGGRWQANTVKKIFDRVNFS